MSYLAYVPFIAGGLCALVVIVDSCLDAADAAILRFYGVDLSEIEE